MTLKITDDFALSGIALGTIMVIVYFHLVNARRPQATPTETSGTSVTKVL